MLHPSLCCRSLCDNIIGVLWGRLNDSRGNSWRHGVHALWLAHELLITGSEQVAVHLLQWLPLLRFLLRRRRRWELRAAAAGAVMAGMCPPVCGGDCSGCKLPLTLVDCTQGKHTPVLWLQLPTEAPTRRTLPHS